MENDTGALAANHRKRQRGESSDLKRRGALKALGLYLRYERPLLKRLGDDLPLNRPKDWEKHLPDVPYPP